MLGGSQIVPFHRPPKKEWKTGAEKKKRLYIDLSKEEDGLEEEVPTFYEDDSESSEESEESFDMQEYIAGLLPGEVVDGKKPLKKANTSHLEELRVKKQKRDRWKYFKMLFRFIIRKRREERERRKHYIIKEWEKKLKEYVEKQQQAVQAKMEQHRKEVLLEQHRSNMRRIRNSRKVSCRPTVTNKLLLRSDNCFGNIALICYFSPCAFLNSTRKWKSLHTSNSLPRI